MTDQFAGVPDWTDALQAEPKYPLREFMRRTGAAIAERDARIKELERREALLTAFVLAVDEKEHCAVYQWCDPMVGERQRFARQALTDAGFPTWAPVAGEGQE